MSPREYQNRARDGIRRKRDFLLFQNNEHAFPRRQRQSQALSFETVTVRVLNNLVGVSVIEIQNDFCLVFGRRIVYRIVRRSSLIVETPYDGIVALHRFEFSETFQSALFRDGRRRIPVCDNSHMRAVEKHMIDGGRMPVDVLRVIPSFRLFSVTTDESAGAALAVKEHFGMSISKILII